MPTKSEKKDADAHAYTRTRRGTRSSTNAGQHLSIHICTSVGQQSVPLQALKSLVVLHCALQTRSDHYIDHRVFFVCAVSWDATIVSKMPHLSRIRGKNSCQIGCMFESSCGQPGKL